MSSIMLRSSSRPAIGKVVVIVVVVVLVAVAAGALLLMGGGGGPTSTTSSSTSSSAVTTSSPTGTSATSSTATSSTNTNTNKLIITAVNLNVTGKAPSTSSVDIAGETTYVGYAGDQVPVSVLLIYRNCSTSGACPGHITAVKSSTQGITIQKTDPAVPAAGSFSSDTGTTTFSITVTLASGQAAYNGPVSIEVDTGA